MNVRNSILNDIIKKKGLLIVVPWFKSTTLLKHVSN